MPEMGFTSHRAETQEQWQLRMAAETLAVTRSELYLDFRYFDLALSALAPAADPAARRLATDGVNLYFEPAALLRLYRENPKYLCRLLLHTVLHCVFRHLWLCAGREPELWGLACDIAVENAIDGLHKKSVERPLGYVRIHAYEAIRAEEGTLAAAPAYRWLARQGPGVQAQLYREFHTDDHRLWPKESDPPTSAAVQAESTWQKLGRQTQSEMERQHDKAAGNEPGSAEEQVRAAARSRRSYRDFLRKFCILREEPHLDLDNFDVNFYTYGLSVYGNVPLIEPQETREAYKVEEIALVVDTSYSTSGALVRHFLEETYALLKQRENFFLRMNLRLIQADNVVQKDEKITCEAELRDAMAHFSLKGGGGTDFRPAFTYVNHLCAEKQFQNLKGLLYFTDGLGIFPEKRPAYDTAFLFLGEKYDDAAVPPWAMKLILDPDEFAPPEAAAPFVPPEPDDDFDAYHELNNT
ncbi:MAG: VWA-like domain-containing protein [Faecalibacterium sp.]|jgi:predicted metal-dependent peptidase|nr:VWA-like domain-containing protein [Faecalibacterium sp.]